MAHRDPRASSEATAAQSPIDRLEALGAVRSRVFVRNLSASEPLEIFMVAAVSAVLLIRFSLSVLGYPQVGGAGLHIAHLLWGGLLMLVGTILVFLYLGQRVLRLAAVVAGAGFGTFIDELGKFITSDNNYFYRPTMSLIYVVFVSLFMVLVHVKRQRGWSEETYVMNALMVLQEAVIRDLDQSERARAMAFLLRVSHRHQEIVEPLRRLLVGIPPIRPARPSLANRLLTRAQSRAGNLLGSVWLGRLLAAYFTLRAISFVVAVIVIAISLISARETTPRLQEAALGAGLVANSFAVIGVANLVRSRFTAFRWFRRSVLVSIFLVDVLAFYEQQLAALTSLSADLLLYVAVNALLRRERARAQEQLGSHRLRAAAH
jgi:hypothetical protein